VINLATIKLNKENIEDIVRKNEYQKIPAIKEIREVYGYGLVEAKEIVDKVLDNIGKEVQSNDSLSYTRINKNFRKTNNIKAGFKTSAIVIYSMLIMFLILIIVWCGAMGSIENGFIIVFSITPFIVLLISLGNKNKSFAERNLNQNITDKTYQSSIEKTLIVGTPHKKETTFQIINKDNTQEIKTVKNNSSQFKEYYKYLDK